MAGSDKVVFRTDKHGHQKIRTVDPIARLVVMLSCVIQLHASLSLHVNCTNKANTQRHADSAKMGDALINLLQSSRKQMFEISVTQPFEGLF